MSDFNGDDLTPFEMPFSVRGKPYLLTEASAGAAVKYRIGLLKGMTLVDGEVKGTSVGSERMNAVLEAELMLVACCVFEKGSAEHVSISLVESWPDRLQQKLLTKIKEVSELNKGQKNDEDSVKNVPSSTTESSPSVES